MSFKSKESKDKASNKAANHSYNYFYRVNRSYFYSSSLSFLIPLVLLTIC